MNYIKQEATDSFFAAQSIVRRLKKAGYDTPPILVLKKEIEYLRKRNFFGKRRARQVKYSLWFREQQ